MKSSFKLALLLAFLFLITFAIAHFVDMNFSGIFLVLFFLSLALAFRMHPSLKGFTYTLCIFAVVALAMYYPSPFQAIGDFKLTGLIVPLLQVIMFGMGSQLSLRDFAAVVKMPKGILVGVFLQVSIMPFIGYVIAVLFGFPSEIAAGIILVGCSPSGMASNVMAFIAKANLSLSVTLTAIMTLFAPVTTPALMKLLAGEFIKIDFWPMLLSIVDIVILPIIAGLIFNAFLHHKQKVKNTTIQLFAYCIIILVKNAIHFLVYKTTEVVLFNNVLIDIGWFLLLPILVAYIIRHVAGSRLEWLNMALSFISMLGIAVIIVIITAAGRESLLQIGALLILACLIHNLTGYFLGYWGSRLLKMPERDCRTIAIEVGMQNGGLASGLAFQMGRVATIGLAAAIFGPLMNITGSSLATWWREKPLKDDVDP